MTQPTSKFKKTLISTALGMALVTTTPGVFATVITANVDYDVNSGAVSGNAFDSSSTEPSNVDVIGGDGDAGSSVFYHTFGNTDGNFGSRVDGTGTFDITGYFQFENTYTNNTGISQDFNFDFTIIAGNLSHNFADLAPGDSLFSSYNIDVMVDMDQDGTFESSVFKSSASISSVDGAPGDLSTFTTDDTILDGAGFVNGTGFAEYFWNETTESLFIGTLAAGDAFDFQYILTTTATGVTTGTSNDCFEGGEFGPQAFVDTDAFEGGSCNSALARSGDPFGPGPLNAFNVSSTPSNPVPEPAGLALFGLGVAALAANRRRKSK